MLNPEGSDMKNIASEYKNETPVINACLTPRLNTNLMRGGVGPSLSLFSLSENRDEFITEFFKALVEYI